MYSPPHLVVDRMDELIVQLLLLENALCQKQNWSFMHLLCRGMVGLGLRRNLWTAGKEQPPPLPPSEGRRSTGVLHQSDYKQMVPFTFTDERQYLSVLRRGKMGAHFPQERTQTQKLCTANFSSGTLKTLINRLLRLKNKIF